MGILRYQSLWIKHSWLGNPRIFAGPLAVGKIIELVMGDFQQVELSIRGRGYVKEKTKS
jgi:hypothetical protein